MSVCACADRQADGWKRELLQKSVDCHRELHFADFCCCVGSSSLEEDSSSSRGRLEELRWQLYRGRQGKKRTSFNKHLITRRSVKKQALSWRDDWQQDKISRQRFFRSLSQNTLHNTSWAKKIRVFARVAFQPLLFLPNFLLGQQVHFTLEEETCLLALSFFVSFPPKYLCFLRLFVFI